MSSGGDKAPMPYKPTNQPGADFQLQSGLNNVYPWVSSLPNDLIPAFKNEANGVMGNPFRGLSTSSAYDVSQKGMVAGQQGLDSAQQGYAAANTGFNQVMPGQLAGSQALYGQADTERANAGALLGQEFGSVLPGQMQQVQALYDQAAQERQRGGQLMDTTFGQIIPGQLEAMKAMYGLGAKDLSYIDPLMQAAFDPQKALYAQMMSQTQQGQDAINARSGVAGSPYGAGLTGDASRNFDINWQNQQLARMLQGINGLGTINNAAQGAYGAGSTIGSQAANTGLDVVNNAYAGATRDSTAGVNAGIAAMGAANNLNNTAYEGATRDTQAGAALGSQAMQTAQQSFGLNQAALAQQQSALDTMQTAGQLPYNTLNAQYGADIQALSAYEQGAVGSMAPTYDFANAQENYLRTGQNATTIGQAGVAANNQTSGGIWSGLGHYFGRNIDTLSHAFGVG